MAECHLSSGIISMCMDLGAGRIKLVCQGGGRLRRSVIHSCFDLAGDLSPSRLLRLAYNVVWQSSSVKVQLGRHLQRQIEDAPICFDWKRDHRRVVSEASYGDGRLTHLQGVKSTY